MAFPQLEDTFSFTGNLEDETQWATLNQGNGELSANGSVMTHPTSPGNKGYLGIYQTPAETTRQAVAILWNDVAANFGTVGAAFRIANSDGTGGHYELTLTWSSPNWLFSVDRFSGTDNQETINLQPSVTTPTDGDWIGFSVSGFGSQTVFNYYNFGTTDPGDYSTWDSSLVVSDPDNPTTAVDTGLYTGIKMHYSSGGSQHLIDTWRGGDQSVSSIIPVLRTKRRHKKTFLRM